MLRTARDEVYFFDKAKTNAGTGIQTVSRKKKGEKTVSAGSLKDLYAYID